MAADLAVLRRLEEVMAEERRAIRSGDLQALGALVARKFAILDRLAAAEPMGARETLARARDLAEINQTLLSAALDGVRSARMRLAAILEAGSRFDTYDRDGRMRTVRLAAGSVERRA